MNVSAQRRHLGCISKKFKDLLEKFTWSRNASVRCIGRNDAVLPQSAVESAWFARQVSLDIGSLQGVALQSLAGQLSRLLKSPHLLECHINVSAGDSMFPDSLPQRWKAEFVRLALDQSADHGSKGCNKFRFKVASSTMDGNANDGRTPLQWALEHGHMAFAHSIAECTGAEFNRAQDERIPTALWWSAFLGTTELLRTLVTKDPQSLEMKARRDGMSALQVSVREQRFDATVILLENGADVNSVNRFGETALMIAAGSGYAAAVELLCQCGADVNIVDRFGEPALLKAAEQNHIDVVSYLSNTSECDFSLGPLTGATALIRAYENKSTKCIDALEKHGDSLRGGSLAQMLSAAVLQEDAEMIDFLVNRNPRESKTAWKDHARESYFCFRKQEIEMSIRLHIFPQNALEEYKKGWDKGSGNLWFWDKMMKYLS